MYGHPGMGNAPYRHGRQQVAVVACAFQLTAAGEIQLTPVGSFRARDGRPQNLPGWTIDAEIAARVIARFDARVNRAVIDYEHQTLKTETNGQPAPAAGWFTGLAWREGQGLYATGVEWTDKARAMIEAGEYQYISPVFAYDPRTGEVTDVLMAAVTNYPAIDGMDELTARAAAKFDITNPHEEDLTVDRVQLIKMLGLKKDASDEDITQAMAALTATAELVGNIRKAAGADDKADLVETVTALKGQADKAEEAIAAAKAGNPDPANFAPVKLVHELQQEVASLKAKQVADEGERLIQAAIAENKLTRAAAREYAESLKAAGNIAELKKFIGQDMVMDITGTQTGGKGPQGDDADGLTADELAVCRATGMDIEEFKKAKEA